MEIKIKCLNGTNDVKIIKKGEWIDLYAADTVKLEAPTQTVENIIEFDSYMINVCCARLALISWLPPACYLNLQTKKLFQRILNEIFKNFALKPYKFQIICMVLNIAVERF